MQTLSVETSTDARCGIRARGRAICCLVSASVALAALLGSAGAAAAKPTSTGPATLPGSLWGVELDGGAAALLGSGGGRRMARGGLTSLFVGNLPASGERRLRGVATRSGLGVFGRLPAAASTSVTGDRCRLLERGNPGTRCVVMARTPADALALARGGVADVVAVRLQRPSQVRSLAAADEHVVAIVPLRAPVLTAPWRAAIRAAHRSPGLDLVVAPRGAARARALSDFLWLLRPVRPSDRKPPALPSGLSTGAVTPAGVALTWQSPSAADGVVKHTVYRDGERVGTVAGRGAQVDGLECAHGYVLEVDAVDGAGNHSAKAPVIATTSACATAAPPAVASAIGITAPVPSPLDLTAPTAPTALTVTNLGARSLTLSWLPATDNVAVAGYRVFVNGADAGTVPAPIADLRDLACDTLHRIGVEAFDASGNASPRTEILVTTEICPDTQAPAAPSGLAISNRTTSSFTLSWNASSDNVAVTGYRSFRDGAGSAGSAATNRSFTGLACGTTYTLAVEAYDAAENTSTRGTLQAATSDCPDTQEPTAPAGLAVSDRAATSMTLSWQASSDNVAVTGYRSFRDGGSSATTTTLSRSYTGLTCGTTYTLAVEAYDAAGNTSPQSTLEAATADCAPVDSQPPSAPAGLTISNRTAGSLTLSWQASPDDLAVTGYDVFRDEAAAGTTATTSHTFGTLVCETTYRLAVEAHDAAGNSSARSEIQATTGACTPTSGASVFLSPAGSDSNACTQAAPCKTFDRGYRVAKAGEQVELGAGLYAGQQVIPDVAKTSATDVIFRPATGAAVRIDSLDVFAKHVEIRGVTVNNDFYVKCHADDVTFRDSKAKMFFIRSADNISLIDSEFGPSDVISQIGTISGTPPCEPAPEHILMDGVYMHDFTHDVDSVHMECLTIEAANYMVIRNSRFYHCEDFNILFKHRGVTVHTHDLLIENSTFDSPWPDGTSAIQFSTPGTASFTNTTIRNNSFNGTLTLKPDVDYDNLNVIGNVGTRFGGTCSQLTSSHNVWSGTPGCGGTDKQAPTGFVVQDGDNAPTDFHLAPGAAAIGNGHPTNHPATDIDGDSRPQGGTPDSGADEFR